MAIDFRDSIELLEEFGFYDVVLPFLLVFTLVFATLEKIKILGKEGRRYNAIIAVVIGFLFVAATNLVDALNEYLPIIALFIGIFLGLMLLLGLFGVKEGSKGVNTLGWLLAGGASILMGVAYLPQIKWFKDFFDQVEDYSGVLIVIAVVIAIVIWLTKGGESSSSSKDS